MPASQLHPLLDNTRCFAQPHKNSLSQQGQYTPPIDWYDDFSQFLADHNTSVRWANDQPPTKAQILKELKTRLGIEPKCAKPSAPMVKVNALLPKIHAIVRSRMQANIIKQDSPEAIHIATALLDGLNECTDGVDERAQGVLDYLENENNLDTILYSMRKDIVDRTARQFFTNDKDAVKNETHERDRYFIAASELGYGVPAAYSVHQYATPDHFNFIKAAFTQLYTPLLMIQTIEAVILGQLRELGYTGIKSPDEPYSYSTVKPWIQYLNSLLKNEVNPYTLYNICDVNEETSAITNINWANIRSFIATYLYHNQIITKPIVDNDQITLIPNWLNTNERNYWLSIASISAFEAALPNIITGTNVNRLFIYVAGEHPRLLPSLMNYALSHLNSDALKNNLMQSNALGLNLVALTVAHNPEELLPLLKKLMNKLNASQLLDIITQSDIKGKTPLLSAIQAHPNARQALNQFLSNNRYTIPDLHWPKLFALASDGNTPFSNQLSKQFHDYLRQNLTLLTRRNPDPLILINLIHMEEGPSKEELLTALRARPLPACVQVAIQLDQFKHKANQLEKRGHVVIAREIKKLQMLITSDYIAYLSGTIDLNQFKINTKNTLDNADPNLKIHRDPLMKSFVAFLTLFTRLIDSLANKVAVKMNSTASLTSFFKTNTSKELDKMQLTIERLQPPNVV